MGVIQRVVKPKTHRAKRALEKRAPKIEENPKQTAFLRGASASDLVFRCMKDLYALKRHNSVLYSDKKDLNPFEDITKIENFNKKYDSSLFTFCCHNKKRPHNLILGRMYDHHLLDMVELGIDQFKSLQEFQNAKVTAGSKPCLIFAGEPFETNVELQRLKNFFIDYFRGEVITNLRLAGVEHLLSFTAGEGKIFMRSYKVLLKKSGAPSPRVELEEIGPSVDFVMRRSQLASADLMKTALKQPIQAKPRKTKNITKDPFGSVMGRVHMERQDMKQLTLKRPKALKSEGKGKASPKRKKKTDATSTGPKKKAKKARTPKTNQPSE